MLQHLRMLGRQTLPDRERPRERVNDFELALAAVLVGLVVVLASLVVSAIG